ncbi:MAG TPA: M23 family metallopeptidase [Bacillota bacterium]|nr:M23 family metallopeptidase [Bacillota bacterium]HOO30663.1 M23 family metallopeptidase [Bacillota bacterium]
MPKQGLAAFMCVLVISFCVPTFSCGAMAAGSDEVSFSTDVMRRSGALELVKAIFSRSWTILLAALGAKSDVVADWESGLYPRKPRLDPGANIISTLKTESELIGPSVAATNALDLDAGKQGSSSSFARAQASIVTHRVEQGESLWTIANSYGVSIETISWANSLANPNKLKVGQVLTFPSVTGVIHEVSRGDTVWTIAKRYGVSRDKIVEANAIADPDALKVKQSLVIPGGKPPVTSSRIVVASRGSSDGRISGAASSGGSLSWPVSGRITSRFGPRWGRMHNGVDIAVPTGTSVSAAAAGCVIFAGWRGGYGRLVILDHGNGLQTYYGHNSAITVSRGEQVAAGERIALSGSSGISTGPHVHFEVRAGGKPQDPMGYLP